MDNVIQISVNEIIPAIIGNHRRDFSHVPRIWKSIEQVGLRNPVMVETNKRPFTKTITILAGTKHETKITCVSKYTLIAGETRWQAHVYGQAKTIRENLDNMEQCFAYDRMITQGGETVESLATMTGRTERYIRERLYLKSLIPPYQEMVAKGQLTIKYAIAMRDLTPEYQQRVMHTWITNKSHVGLSWFTEQCRKAYEDQVKANNQLGLFNLQSIPPVTPPSQEIRLPDCPLSDSPQLTDQTTEPIQQMEKMSAHWLSCAEQWEQLGKKDKANMCKALAQQLAHAAKSLNQTAVITRQESPTERILRHLKQGGGALSTKRIYQQCRLTKAKALPLLNQLIEQGKISVTKHGRSTIYALV